MALNDTGSNFKPYIPFLLIILIRNFMLINDGIKILGLKINKIENLQHDTPCCKIFAIPFDIFSQYFCNADLILTVKHQ